MAISYSQTKTETFSVRHRTLLRVSARFARPSVRLLQPQSDASKRLRQLQSSERQKRHQSDTASEAFPQPTTSNSTTKTALSRRAHTTKQNRVIIRLPFSHVRDAMQFIPIEDILDNLVAKNLGKFPNEEDIATTATYYFVDVCSTYPASLIRFAANVLIRHFEPILERTTPRYKAYETLKAKPQFVKAMRALRAGMFSPPHNLEGTRYKGAMLTRLVIRLPATPAHSCFDLCHSLHGPRNPPAGDLPGVQPWTSSPEQRLELSIRLPKTVS